MRKKITTIAIAAIVILSFAIGGLVWMRNGKSLANKNMPEKIVDSIQINKNSDKLFSILDAVVRPETIDRLTLESTLGISFSEDNNTAAQFYKRYIYNGDASGIFREVELRQSNDFSKGSFLIVSLQDSFSNVSQNDIKNKALDHQKLW